MIPHTAWGLCKETNLAEVERRIKEFGGDNFRKSPVGLVFLVKFDYPRSQGSVERLNEFGRKLIEDGLVWI